MKFFAKNFPFLIPKQKSLLRFYCIHQFQCLAIIPCSSITLDTILVFFFFLTKTRSSLLDQLKRGGLSIFDFRESPAYRKEETLLRIRSIAALVIHSGGLRKVQVILRILLLPQLLFLLFLSLLSTRSNDFFEFPKFKDVS